MRACMHDVCMQVSHIGDRVKYRNWQEHTPTTREISAVFVACFVTIRISISSLQHRRARVAHASSSWVRIGYEKTLPCCRFRNTSNTTLDFPQYWKMFLSCPQPPPARPAFSSLPYPTATCQRMQAEIRIARAGAKRQMSLCLQHFSSCCSSSK